MNSPNLIRIKEELDKWKIELEYKLSVKNNKLDEKFILIDKKWFDNFEKNFLSEKLTDFQIKQKKEKYNFPFNSMKLNLDDKFNKSKSILPDIEIFVLNESSLSAFQTFEEDKNNYNTIIGSFYNKLLLLQLDIGKNKNSNIFCLFFLDDNNSLRQGYLTPLNNYNLEIKNEFEKNEPLKIFKRNGINIWPSKVAKMQLKFSLCIFKGEAKPKKNILKIKIIKDDIPISSNNKNNNNKFQEDMKNKFKEYWDKNRISFNTLDKNKNKANNNNIKIDQIIKKNIRIKPEKKLIKKVKIKEFMKEKQKKLDNLIKKGENAPSALKIIKLIGKEKKEEKEIIKDNENKIEAPNIPDIYEPDEISDQYIQPVLIGLANIGATCYMNATLQCFSHIDRLKYYLLDEYIYNELQKEKDTNKKLSFAFAEVLKHLWDENSSQKYYAPEHFKQVISEMNPLFKGIAANDSKDLIIFMLEKMHKELNTKQGNNIINNQEPNPCDFNAVYLDFINDYQSKNDSIITQEFYGYNNIISSCSKCTNIIHNVQTFNILFFPLEEVRKFKNYNENRVFIMDCFDYYQKIDIYPSYYCMFCRDNCLFYSQTRLVDTPKTLIINLNRGKGMQFNVDIIFDERLDIRNYVYNQQSPYYYELVGMLCHYGTNDMGGHFIAFCKDSTDGNWYKFNDAIVTLSSFEEVCQSGMPYVLYYSYIQV